MHSTRILAIIHLHIRRPIYTSSLLPIQEREVSINQLIEEIPDLAGKIEEVDIDLDERVLVVKVEVMV